LSSADEQAPLFSQLLEMPCLPAGLYAPMLKKRLSSWNEVSRSGIARARLTDAGLRL